MIEIDDKAPPELERFRSRALIVGIAGLMLCGVGAIFDAPQFFRSYLLAYVFWIGIALGCWAILMLQHMSGGAWGIVIRRVLEAATRTFPILAALFVPIVFGATYIYKWMHPDDPNASEEFRKMMEHKDAYLNWGFFIIRAIFYFFIWNLIS